MFSYIQNRGVQHLVHFTRIRNLPGILRYGLLSRQELASRGIDHAINDLYRFDFLPAVCLSVSFPNYKMFYGLRMDYPEEDWAVLRLKPELIDQKRCVFSHANAAKRELANLPLEPRMTPEALHGMFADHNGMPARSSLNIPDHFTTNPQAEILVLDPIEPSYITDVIIDAKDRVKNYGAILALAKEHNGSPQFLHGKPLFDARIDFAHWRAVQNG